VCHPRLMKHRVDQELEVKKEEGKGTKGLLLKTRESSEEDGFCTFGVMKFNAWLRVLREFVRDGAVMQDGSETPAFSQYGGSRGKVKTKKKKNAVFRHSHASLKRRS